MDRKINVLIAKPGLDGHDRGALVIVQALREAGMNVAYTGIRRTPEQIVEQARQRQADCIGLSCLSGAHNTLFPQVMQLLREQGMGDVLVIGGGIIPAEDIPYLWSQGVARVFTPGAQTDDVIDYIRIRVSERARDICFKEAFV